MLYFHMKAFTQIMQGKSVPACSTPTFVKGVCERASKSQTEAQHLAATISEDTFQQKIIFISVHSEVTHGDLFVGKDEGGDDVAVLPKEFMDYLFAGCLWLFSICSFKESLLDAVIKSFIVAFGVWVVIQGHDLGEVFTDLLNVSVKLPMHTDAYLFQVEEQMVSGMPNPSSGAIHVKGMHYLWYHTHCHPWGCPLLMSCLKCSSIHLWSPSKQGKDSLGAPGCISICQSPACGFQMFLYQPHAYQKQYKSAEIVPTDSSDALTDLEPTPPVASSVLAVIDNNTALLDTCDSVDQELDSLPKTNPAEECMKGMQSKAVKARRSRKKEVENAAASECTPDVPIKVLYNMLIFPASELKKDNIKKQKGLLSYFKLDSNKLYDTWKAQLLVRISQKLNLSWITYEDYDVSFTVPRIYPSPLLIMTDDDYNFLLKHVRKAKEPTANVYVQEKMMTTSHKHKCDDLGSSAEGLDMEISHKKWKKKKNKTHSPKDTNIDEADHPLNKNIHALQDCWVCHKKPGCESKFCFINPLDGGTHIPLTFACLDCWAAAMLKGPAMATLETPPNHKHF
ncbi:hypothetical protein F5141DRAFT_1067872 [Pisolithus sp. B1]|nr:hypothetical protein F5141DRAFT_1067872 [Pisolithus sp. B1]